MRPVCRGVSPQAQDFDPYVTAQPYLISRLGGYCSYCERRVVTQLAVEHIQPKSLPLYTHLIGRWDNYLLGCVNCNSTKGPKNVVLADLLLPDRDNTFLALEYTMDGRVVPRGSLTPELREKVRATLSLTGLDKSISVALDENGKQIAIDRVSQRMEVWAVALEAKADVDANPGNQAVVNGAIRSALGYGHFSIWMEVFSNNVGMRNRLIDVFPGTRSSGCFSGQAHSVSPAPNPDNLPNGGKI